MENKIFFKLHQSYPCYSKFTSTPRWVGVGGGSWNVSFHVFLLYIFYIPNLIKINPVEKKKLTHRAQRSTHNDRRQTIAKAYVSDLGDIKIHGIYVFKILKSWIKLLSTSISDQLISPAGLDSLLFIENFISFPVQLRYSLRYLNIFRSLFVRIWIPFIGYVPFVLWNLKEDVMKRKLQSSNILEGYNIQRCQTFLYFPRKKPLK